MTVQSFTLYDVLERNAALFPRRPAVLHEGGSLTSRELLRRVDALATGLAGHGISKGERVAILAQNHPAYLELYGACARLGAIAHPINWRLTAQEVGRVLERAAPRLMVVDEACLPQVADGPTARPGIPYWYKLGPNAAEGFTPLEQLTIESGAEERPPVGTDEPFVVISTAAVDVIPRGAVLSHANLLVANLQAAAAFGLGPADVNLAALPLYHIAALGMTLAVLQAGGANVVMTRFDADEAVRLIDRHRVTLISSFPPVLANLLDAAAKAGSRLESLRIVNGLEAPPTIERLHKETGARFWTGFGQSETTGFVTLVRADERPGAAGRPLPLCPIRLVDDLEREVPTGTPGEILVRGPMVFQGYYAQPEVTAHTFRGGWHHTGDVGRFDEEGYLYYVKRKPEKELIKPGGENVYPAEVEAVIQEVAGVRAACVFGVPDAQWGEAIRAVVEAPAGHGLTPQAIIDHVGSRIARFKRPKTVVFTEALPRAKSGEVDREAVKAAFGQSG
jgi:long-chain acyl-CoA synthetase